VRATRTHRVNRTPKSRPCVERGARLWRDDGRDTRPCCHVDARTVRRSNRRSGYFSVVVGTLDPDHGSRSRVELLKAQECRLKSASKRRWSRNNSPRTCGTGALVGLRGTKGRLHARRIVAMSDGSSQWITGEAAGVTRTCFVPKAKRSSWGRYGTRDDPVLTPDSTTSSSNLFACSGRGTRGRPVRPCLERSGELGLVLDELGEHDVLQLLVEGDPRPRARSSNRVS